MARQDLYNTSIDNDEQDSLFFSHNFNKYVLAELFWLEEKYSFRMMLNIRRWVFWSRNDGSPKPPPTFTRDCWDFIMETSTTSKNFNDKIRAAFMDFACRYSRTGNPFLLQFWEPKGGTMEGPSFLTTQHLPFALQLPKGQTRDDIAIIEGLCEYRMICKDYKYYLDVDHDEDGVRKQQEQDQLLGLGVPGRVFRNQCPELSPNVKYYSPIEYPLLHDALSCQVKSSYAFPVFEPFSQTCVGVVEIVSSSRYTDPHYVSMIVSDAFEKVGLTCSADCKHHFRQRSESSDMDEACKAAISEASDVVYEVNKLLLAQIWMPCRACWALVDHGCTPLTSLITVKQCGLWYNDLNTATFSTVCSLLRLGKERGVVGGALLSPNLLYCTNVSQFSIAEYPMAHFAREYGFSGCFAICLQSSYTGNDTYVLEFFFHANYNTSGDPRTLLREILGTLRENFQSFKLASGAELMEELPIKVIDFKNGKKLDDVLISPRHELLQNGGMTRVKSPVLQSIDFQNVEKQDFVSMSPELKLLRNGGVTQVDSSDQQSMDVINDGSKVVSVERSNINVSCLQEKGIEKMPQRESKKSGVKIEISLEDIIRTSKMRLEDAAEELNVGRSTLKRACRDYGFARWPPRKSRFVDREQIPHLNNGLPSNKDPISIVNTKPKENTTMQDANVVTIKAKYGNDITIKFGLSLSSTLVDLKQKVAKRLNLEVETYDIKYRDPEDGDLILIACDEDLHDYIRTSKLLDNTSIKVEIFTQQSQMHERTGAHYQEPYEAKQDCKRGAESEKETMEESGCPSVEILGEKERAQKRVKKSKDVSTKQVLALSKFGTEDAVENRKNACLNEPIVFPMVLSSVEELLVWDSYEGLLMQYSDEDLLVRYIFDKNYDADSEPVIKMHLHGVPHEYATRDDMQSLRPNAWFSHVPINLMAIKLTNAQRSKYPKGDHRIWYFPTYVAQKIIGDEPYVGNIEKISHSYFGKHRYTGDLNTCQEIYIPFNYHQQHWLCLKIDMVKSMAYLFDSKPSRSEDDDRLRMATLLVQSMHELLQLKYGDDYHHDVRSFEVHKLKDAPLQGEEDSHDCGMFVIKYMQKELLPSGVHTIDPIERHRLLLNLLRDPHNLCWNGLMVKLNQYKRGLIESKAFFRKKSVPVWHEDHESNISKP